MTFENAPKISNWLESLKFVLPTSSQVAFPFFGGFVLVSLAGLVAGLVTGLIVGPMVSVAATLSAIVSGAASYAIFSHLRRSEARAEATVLWAATDIERAARDYVRLKHPDETIVEPTVFSLVPALLNDGVWDEENVNQFRRMLRIRNSYAHGRMEPIRSRDADAIIADGRLLKSKLDIAMQKIRKDTHWTNSDHDVPS